MSMHVKNYLVIHGHFYQPPREDPWTGTIPKQPSAEPYQNWNVRINRECYAANSASRVLNSRGNIEKIINNYRYFSFNFGPTLLSWLKTEAPGVYARIIDADKHSCTVNNGHGNAIAQSYNHTILPLDPKDIARTQIHWGIEDFYSHFGRKPEGMWLPETAVNTAIVDELIAQKIQFVILSPCQAEAVCQEGAKTWRSLFDHPVPSHKAYRIERPGGNLAVVFYDPTLASGISFGHFLTDADKLKQTLDGYYNENDAAHLVNIATDGEIYGHHEPFGDMCFAALASKIDDRFIITNYANYLEQHPPHELVKLKSGEDDAGTSWSCSHGVSRWYKNCGCSTGGKEGWDQKWRTPLRNAFNYLRNEATKTFIREIAQYGKQDAYSVRDGYIEVLCGKKTKKDYIGELFPSASEEDRSRIISLLEGQKYMMYMFTSCGWFFSEISGIEPVQNMKYALRLIELYKPWFNGTVLEKLLVDLSEARSNIASKGTGRTIMETDVLPYSKTDFYGAAVLIFRCLLHPYASQNYGVYTLIEMEKTGFTDITDFSSRCTVENSETCRQLTCEFSILSAADSGISIRINTADSTEVIRAADLPDAVKTEISQEYRKSLEQECFDHYSGLFENLKLALTVSNQLGTMPSDMVRKTAEVIISELICRKLEDQTRFLSDQEIAELQDMMDFKNTHGLEVNEKEISGCLSRILAYQTDYFSGKLSSEITCYIQKLCSLADRGGFTIEKTIPQNIVYELIHKNEEAYFSEIQQKKFDAFLNLKMLISLGETLGIEVEEMKKRLLAP
ncbi:MAG: DUF3536 domain-containing protein [Spirochaetales bacterium]|nr:DUF3536 domain-containing protein [Spirochaetales bacterium]